MPSKTINCTIAKWARIKKAFNARFPVPMIKDSKDPKNEIPEFNENEWPFEYIKRLVARIVKSYENDMQGKDNTPELDNDMVTLS